MLATKVKFQTDSKRKFRQNTTNSHLYLLVFPTHLNKNIEPRTCQLYFVLFSCFALNYLKKP